jgi:hypothetical protein
MFRDKANNEPILGRLYLRRYRILQRYVPL